MKDLSNEELNKILSNNTSEEYSQAVVEAARRWQLLTNIEQIVIDFFETEFKETEFPVVPECKYYLLDKNIKMEYEPDIKRLSVNISGLISALRDEAEEIYNNIHRNYILGSVEYKEIVAKYVRAKYPEIVFDKLSLSWN